jgi:hypothetical protein
MLSLELAQPLTILSANTAIITFTFSSLLFFLLSVSQVEELYILAYIKTAKNHKVFASLPNLKAKKIYFHLCLFHHYRVLN